MLTDFSSCLDTSCVPVLRVRKVARYARFLHAQRGTLSTSYPSQRARDDKATVLVSVVSSCQAPRTAKSVFGEACTGLRGSVVQVICVCSYFTRYTDKQVQSVGELVRRKYWQNVAKNVDSPTCMVV